MRNPPRRSERCAELGRRAVSRGVCVVPVVIIYRIRLVTCNRPRLFLFQQVPSKREITHGRRSARYGIAMTIRFKVSISGSSF